MSQDAFWKKPREKCLDRLHLAWGTIRDDNDNVAAPVQRGLPRLLTVEKFDISAPLHCSVLNYSAVSGLEISQHDIKALSDFF